MKTCDEGVIFLKKTAMERGQKRVLYLKNFQKAYKGRTATVGVLLQALPPPPPPPPRMSLALIILRNDPFSGMHSTSYLHSTSLIYLSEDGLRVRIAKRNSLSGSSVVVCVP